MKYLGTLLIIGILSVSFSCKEKNDNLDPEYPFTISVKTLSDSVLVTNIRVQILAPDNTGKLKEHFIGFTDDNGKVEFKNDLQAVFTARATRGLTPPTQIGCAEVYLRPNKRVYKTVYIEPFDPVAGGCFYTP